MKNFNVKLLLLVGIMSISTTSCIFQNCIRGEGSIEVRRIDVKDFDAFHIFGACIVTIKEGRSQKVEVESYPNIIDKLLEDSYVKNSTYSVGIDACVRGQNSDINIMVTIPKLTGVSLTGSGHVSTIGVFDNVNDLDISLSGSGKIDLNLGSNMSNVSSAIGGSGSIKLAGKTRRQSQELSGSGSFQMTDLISDQCEIDISGSGQSYVFAADHLNVEISGSGSVCYKGHPKVASDISGSGGVRDCN